MGGWQLAAAHSPTWSHGVQAHGRTSECVEWSAEGEAAQWLARGACRQHSHTRSHARTRIRPTAASAAHEGPCSQSARPMRPTPPTPPAHLRAVVALQQGDAHLGQDLHDALLQALLQVLLRVLGADVGHLQAHARDARGVCSARGLQLWGGVRGGVGRGCMHGARRGGSVEYLSYPLINFYALVGGLTQPLPLLVVPVGAVLVSVVVGDVSGTVPPPTSLPPPTPPPPLSSALLCPPTPPSPPPPMSSSNKHTHAHIPPAHSIHLARHGHRLHARAFTPPPPPHSTPTHPARLRARTHTRTRTHPALPRIIHRHTHTPCPP